MKANEVEKLKALGLPGDQVEALKARGLGLAGIAKLVQMMLAALLGSGMLSGGAAPAGAAAAPMPAKELKKLEEVGVTGEQAAALRAAGLDFNKIMALIMGILKLVTDLGIFTPTTTAVPPQ